MKGFTKPHIIASLIIMLASSSSASAEGQFSLKDMIPKSAGELAKLRESAEKGDSNSKLVLGLCHREGIQLPRDTGEAIKWIRRSAEQGNVYAEFWLGYILTQGSPREREFKNINEGLTWLHLAANKGLIEAQHSLGSFHSGLGKGNEHLRNDAAAVSWYLMAANNGDLKSCETLAYRYRTGTGTPMNKLLALKWYLICQKHMSPNPAVDQLKMEMSKADIETAEEQADRWIPEHNRNSR